MPTPPIEKPYPDFPLTIHRGSGQWCKRIAGKRYYFGPLADWKGALEKYLAERHALQLGKTRDEARALAAGGDPETGVTVNELVNRFLEDKREQWQQGRLTERSFEDYCGVGRLLISCFGRSAVVTELTVNDFARLQKFLHNGRQLITVRNLITKVKVVFNHAVDRELLDRPVKFGRGFHIPKQLVDREKIDKPVYTFEAADLRGVLRLADQRMQAMIYLGINGAMGNRDVAMIRERHIDFDGGWIDYPRRKTGQQRAFPLWPETAAALKETVANRPTAKRAEEYDGIFISRNGLMMAHKNCYQVTRLFRQLLNTAGEFPDGVGFYTLRRTFITVGRETGLDAVVKHVAGHRANSVTDGYTAHFDDQKLVDVCTHVRSWLFESSGRRSAERPTIIN